MVTVNVGTIDRIIRFVIGIVLIGLGFFFYTSGTTALGIGLMVFSLIPLVTATIKFCPLYSILGLSTCPVKNTS